MNLSLNRKWSQETIAMHCSKSNRKDLKPSLGSRLQDKTLLPSFHHVMNIWVILIFSSWFYNSLQNKCGFEFICVEYLVCLLAPVGFKLVGHLILLCPRQHRPAGVHLMEWLGQCLNTTPLHIWYQLPKYPPHNTTYIPKAQLAPHILWSNLDEFKSCVFLGKKPLEKLKSLGECG